MQTVIFDLDDTLVHCNKYFDQIVEQFLLQMQAWFKGFAISPAQVKSKQVEIDIQNVNKYGFTTDHFPQSFVETYLFYSQQFGRLPDPTEMQLLKGLGEAVYLQPAEPYPHMEDTLTRLQREGHELVLYTGGIEEVQRRKITNLRLDRFFGQRIFIRQRKDIAALKGILHKEGYPQKSTWMIGNSLRTDIEPALELGLNCIYIPAFTEWEYNIIQISAKPQGAYLQLNALQEVPQAISQYIIAM